MRVLDLGTQVLVDGLIGKPRNLAWPVHAFRLTLPTQRAGGNSLDPFERVILQLIEIGGFQGEQTLADEACLPSPLVRSVLTKLRTREILDKTNQIAKHLDITPTTKDQPIDCATAIVFRELIGGKLIPYIYVVSEESPLVFRNFDEGKFWKMSHPSHSETVSVPTTREIQNIIRLTRKRERIQQQRSLLPDISQIQVIEEPEFYYLRCHVGISSNNAKIRVADPFLGRMSSELMDGFESRLLMDEALQRWVDNWRDRLVSDQNKSQSNLIGDSNEKTPARQNLFPRLMDNLEISPGESSRDIKKTFASLEYCLYYLSELYEQTNTIRRLQYLDVNNFESQLVQAAEAVGLIHEPGFFHFVSHGKLEAYWKQEAHLNTVLTICILQAEGEKTHALRKLASKNPRFLLDVRELNYLRNSESHVGVPMPWETVHERWGKFLSETVTTLLPNVKIEDGLAVSQLDYYSNLKLLARNSLTARLGHRCLVDVGFSVEEALFNAEIFGNAEAIGKNASGFVINLCSALQGVFDLLCALNGKDAGFSESHENLIRRAKSRAYEFRLEGFDDSFQTVSPKRLSRALRGEDTSLGALIISFLLLAKDEDLMWLSECDAEILRNCSELLKLRGHGNQRVELTNQKIQNLLDSTTHSISKLMELRGEGYIK
jgi:hypothetical protein